MFIHAGSAETMFDTLEEFANQLKAVDDDQVKFYLTEASPHNLIESGSG